MPSSPYIEYRPENRRLNRCRKDQANLSMLSTIFKHRNTKWVGADNQNENTGHRVTENTPMAISRRNILVTLGALVGGGGALVSTGAFTTVSAERTVDVSTAGDASAFLSMTGDGNYVTDNSDDGTLTIDLGGPEDTGFNQEALTTIDGVVTITNNAADDSSATIGVSTESVEGAEANGSASLRIQNGDDEDVAIVTFYVGETEANSINDGSAQTVDAGESAELDVEIDTRQDTIDESDAETGGLTIIATED